MTKIAFREQLQALINKTSMENGSNTPDYILAEYLTKCLSAFDEAVGLRDSWYRDQRAPHEPGKPTP